MEISLPAGQKRAWPKKTVPIVLARIQSEDYARATHAKDCCAIGTKPGLVKKYESAREISEVTTARTRTATKRALGVGAEANHPGEIVEKRVREKSQTLPSRTFLGTRAKTSSGLSELGKKKTQARGRAQLRQCPG
jgi:hypothetical protein